MAAGHVKNTVRSQVGNFLDTGSLIIIIIMIILTFIIHRIKKVAPYLH